MFAIWLLAVASAGEPSLDKPDVPAPVEGECVEIRGLDLGSSLPAGLLNDEGKAACSAIIVPISQYQDLLQVEIWGNYVASRYRLDVEMLTLQRDWYKEAYGKPTPLFQRPGVLLSMGTAVGVGAVAASAWSLNAIAQ
jgi:hypothetical protein